MTRSYAPHAFFFLVSFLPALALAEAEVCQVTGVASLSGLELDCHPVRMCNSDAECDGLSCDPLIGVCMPECGTLVACTEHDDCAAIEPLAQCVFRATGSSLARDGFCELSTLPITFCEGAGRFDDAGFIACHTLPFSDTLTPSWFDGDCDRDGCPNNNDPTVCDAGMACGPAFAPERTCHRRLIGVGFEQCTLTRGAGEAQLSCATQHECERGPARMCPSPGFVCTDGACGPSVCGTLYSCRADSDCEGTPLGDGSCLAAPEIFGAGRGGDGFCTFASFATDVRCATMVTSCLETPSGAPTLDFFQGDCDGDGCPNGSDDSVCAFGYGACTPTMSLACGTPLELPTDAGVPFPDAGPFDAGALDGGVSIDAPFDAPPFDAAASPVVAFNGGGGLRCAATHGSRGGFAPFAWLALALAMRSRRRS